MSFTELTFTFRQGEVSQLLEWVRAGESASVVGVSGVGKSNLFNHLLDPRIQELHLTPDQGNYIFVRTNFHYLPDFTDRSIYSLILDQLELLDSEIERLGLEQGIIDCIGKQHEALLDVGQDALKVQRYFKLAVGSLLADSKRRLVLLFDQFDDVYREAEPRLFANLRGLRETYKYRISYLVFTRDILPNLAATDSGREEFYELLVPNIMGLRPYNKEDAALLLNRVASRNQLPLDDSLVERLFQLIGGHAGLLRTTYLGVVQDGLVLPQQDKDASQILLEMPNVRMECDKIWESLNLEEQRALAYCAHGLLLDEPGKRIERLLRLKGLLGEEAKGKVFSPLFALYAKDQEALWNRPIYLDEKTRQVWVHGRPAPPLAAQEFRLFRRLYTYLGELVLKDELVDAGWPGIQGGVSDEALTAAMSRLRKKIEFLPNSSHFLESIRGQGYKLRIK
jgi:DNA-binding winged helix-turn-helix (wHTH) protein